MKKLESLNKNQTEQLEITKTKWLNKIFNYTLYNSISDESIITSMEELYKFCNLEKPKVFIMDSPLACQYAVNLLANMDQVKNQVRNQVGDQVEDQVWNQVWYQVKDQVWNQVRDQVWNQVWNQVGDQVGDQVEDQVGDQVGDQVRDQVGDQVGNQVKDQVWNQVGDQVGDQVEDQVWNQVWNQVGDQVWNQVRNQVGHQVRNQVGDQVRDQVENQKLNFYSFSTYINYSDFGWLSFYEYFLNNTNILKEYKESLLTIIKFVENSYISIQLDNLCIVSKYPKFISRNENNDLHNTKQAAIEFKDGYKQYYVNGRFIEEDTFLNSQEVESAKIIFKNEVNEDIKACIITIIKENFGNGGLLKMLDAVLIDEQKVSHSNGYTETLRLYHSKQKYSFLQNSKGELNQPYAWFEETCPSTGAIYLLDTCPTFTNVLDCAKWHRPENIPSELNYFWLSAN